MLKQWLFFLFFDRTPPVPKASNEEILYPDISSLKLSEPVPTTPTKPQAPSPIMKTPDSKTESGLSPLGFTPELEGYKTPLPPPPEQTIKGKTVLKLSAALYRFSSSVHTFISVDPIVQVLLNNLENSKTAITCESLPSSPSLLKGVGGVILHFNILTFFF